MQGMSIAPAMPGSVGKLAAADGAVSGGAEFGDDVDGVGAGLFGAILAGQIKGKLAAKAGSEANILLDGQVGGKSDPFTKDKPDADAAALAEMLAAAGIVLLPSEYVRQGGGDAGGSDVPSFAEGELAPSVTIDVAVKDAAVKDVAVSNAVEKGKQFAAGNPASIADNEVPEDGAGGEEKVAGGGNLLPALEVSTESVVEKNAIPDAKVDFAAKLDEVVNGGAASTDSASAPVLASPVQAVVGQRPVEQASAMQIAVPVASPGWGEALADKVMWMSSQGSQVAELRLDPPHLGPLEVRITVTNDQATAVFVSHHSAVREAIETAMPRLREMLADSGIMLGNTMVGAESFAQQQSQAQGSNGGSRNAGRGEEGGANAATSGTLGVSSAAAAMGRGLVDTFV